MHSDIHNAHFIYRLTPKTWHPYISIARFDRPVGTWLLFWPCIWAMALAHKQNAIPAEKLITFLSFFAAGSLLMRSAGCVINDLWDQDIDAKVTRTKTRPLASGALSRRKAIIFLGILLLLSLGILLQMNQLTITLGLCSIILVVLYPVMKRITWWPQLFLGFTFNWGALMGYSALTGSTDSAALLLYTAGIFWTLAYDTIYAHQDIEDDRMIGVKSTALRLKDLSRPFIMICFALSIALIALAADVSAAHPFIWLALFHVAWQLRIWKEHDAQSALRAFKSNIILGAIFCLAFMI